MNFEQEPRRENAAAGILGALLGALAGLVCIILTGRLHIAASLSGFVMSVCTLKGYEKLAGALSKKGAVISCVVILFMTYFAHHLDIALEIAEKLDMPLAGAFVSIPKLLRLNILNGAVFWGDLAQLYLFAILGAAPAICNSMAFSAASQLPVQGPAAQGAQEQPSPAEFYAADPLLSRPVRTDEFMMGAAAGFLGLILFIWGSRHGTNALMMAGLAAFFGASLLYLPALYYSADASVLFVRANGTLWRVVLTTLNTIDTYRFTDRRFNPAALRWHRLNPGEQERAKSSILRAVDAQTNGQLSTDRLLYLSVFPFSELTVEKETKWSWKFSYLLNNGKRRTMPVHKVYPDFAPTPGQVPSHDPVPVHWGRICVVFALVLAFGLLGLAADAANAPHSRPGQDDPPRVSASEPDTRPAASIPEEDDPAEGAGSGAIKITPENYQSLFHLADEYGYQYIGLGYLPVSADASGENTFVPAYVPYCDAPVYSEDGRTLTTAAHGMQADITIIPTEGDARDAVEAMYEAFAASGADIYEESVSETEYNEEYGIAVKHLFYFEENGTLPRMCFFYADEPFHGHCYAARIVYLTEQQDEEYPALVQELGDVFGLNLPEIDSFEP